MHMKKKLIALVVCLTMLAIALIGGTMAYFTDDEEQTNTFTVGKVEISLDETQIDADGVTAGNQKTTESNAYKLIPGREYTKDPTITVEEGSEPAYIGAIVTIEGDVHSVLGEATGSDNLDIHKIVSGGLVVKDAEMKQNWNGLSMVFETNDCVIYQKAEKNSQKWTMYIFVKEEKDAEEEVVLFDTLKIDANWNNEQMAKFKNMKINVKAYAVQQYGFTSCFDAMTTAFDTAFDF